MFESREASSQGGGPASQTKSKTSARSLGVPTYADGTTSVRHVRVKESEKGMASEEGNALQVSPQMARRVLLSRTVVQQSRPKESEVAKHEEETVIHRRGHRPSPAVESRGALGISGEALVFWHTNVDFAPREIPS